MKAMQSDMKAEERTGLSASLRQQIREARLEKLKAETVLLRQKAAIAAAQMVKKSDLVNLLNSYTSGMIKAMTRLVGSNRQQEVQKAIDKVLEQTFMELEQAARPDLRGSGRRGRKGPVAPTAKQLEEVEQMASRSDFERDGSHLDDFQPRLSA